MFSFSKFASLTELWEDNNFISKSLILDCASHNYLLISSSSLIFSSLKDDFLSEIIKLLQYLLIQSIQYDHVFPYSLIPIFLWVLSTQWFHPLALNSVVATCDSQLQSHQSYQANLCYHPKLLGVRLRSANIVRLFLIVFRGAATLEQRNHPKNHFAISTINSELQKPRTRDWTTLIIVFHYDLLRFP